MGFVDDVLFYLDHQAKIIHMRSASRASYRGDLGVNHQRIAEIRAIAIAKALRILIDNETQSTRGFVN